MRKFYSYIVAAILMAGSLNAWATDVLTTFANKTSGTWSANMSLPCASGGLSWVTSAAPNSFESSSPERGIQYSKTTTNLTTTISGATITKVVVVASTNGTANVNSLSVTVGGSSIGSTQNMPKENNKTYTFETNTGKSGEIKVTMTNAGGDSGKSTYIKSITVTYTTYTVTYDANGGTGTMTDSNSPYMAGATVTTKTNTFTRDGYTFGHWNTASEDNGTTYSEGATFTINANTTLYAQWVSASSPNILVSGSGISSNALNLAYTASGDQTATASFNNMTGYTSSAVALYNDLACNEAFSGNWFSASLSGSTITYNASANAGAARTVYMRVSAVYNETTYYSNVIAITQAAMPCTVTYNSNGGSGSMLDDGSPYAYGSTVTVLANGFTAPTGKAFDHWSTASDGGTTYDPDDTFNITGDVTLYAQWRTLTTYSLVTSVDQLISGRHYIIASGATGTVSAMGSQNNGHYRNVVNPVSSNTGVISETEGVYEFVINGPEIITKNNNTVMVYTIYDVSGASGGYLYASSSSSNYMDTQAFNDNNGKWTISIANTGDATIEAQGTNTRYKMRFNSNRFSCYGDNTSVSDLPYLYIKNEVTPQYEFYKDITAHTEATGLGNTDGWYFIASPVNSDDMAPTSVTNMIAETAANYDLYRLSGNMWENYQNNEHTAGFVIANGTGYLYSNASNTTLKFSGSSVKSYSTDDNTVTPANSGWNLLGNPYTFPVKVSRAFSELNNGSAVANKDANSIINPGAGIAVYGTGDVTFTKYEPEEQSAGPSNINVILAQQVVNRGGAPTSSVLDNAIVSFNEGSQLEKFYFGTQDANIYIPQGTEEYAIVSAEAQGEMPVSFKAAKDGEYTLTVNAEGVEMNYLHLIDNLTGADTDLLATPSYTFNARTTDYASRFRLVFGANDENGASTSSATFAYVSNGQVVVNGTGILQVVDMLGRIVASQEVTTANCQLSTANYKTGVYVLRLVNNGDVKTQKMVIE